MLIKISPRLGGYQHSDYTYNTKKEGNTYNIEIHTFESS